MKTILDKYHKMNIQAKAAIWFAICSILQKGISVVTIPLFTKIMSPEQYGTYSLYLSWFQILTIATSFYLYYGVFNNALVKFADAIDRYIASMQGLTMMLSGVCFGIYFVFRDRCNEVLGLSSGMMIMMFLEMMVAPAFHYWAGKQRFDFKYKGLVVLTLVKSFLNPVLGLVAVMMVADTNRAFVRILSVVVVEVAFCGAIMIKQFIRGKCIFVGEYWKYALKLGLPLLPHYLSGMILNQGDRVMIEKMVGRAEVAFYSVAYSIGMLAQIFTLAINNALTPWVYKRLKDEKYESISGTFNVLLLLVSVIAVMIMLCSPELVLIFGSSEYTTATYAIPPVAAGVFFIFLYNLLATPQFYFEKTQFMMISSIIAAVVNIGLNYVFIPLFGYVAAGYTTLICYVCYSLGHAIISRRILKKNIPDAKLYNGVFITFLSVCVIMAGVGCNFVFEYWYIRYTVIFIAFIVLFAKRKTIIEMLKVLRKK